MNSKLHRSPATIEVNNFKFKSLSCWSLNFFLGCSHGCRICYVPGTSANKQKNLLQQYEVMDPVMEWGDYVLVRPWNERAFMNSLKHAEDTPASELNRDGNRAVCLCSTTDPYQVIRHPEPQKQKSFNAHARSLRRRALVAIRDNSTLNVRILTRSALAIEDFDILRGFGDRLMLGVSLPTLDPVISRFYEPMAPAPSHRLNLIREAHAAGIHTYVAVAPVYPEVGYKGILEVFHAVKPVNPLTVFMEPVNLRLGVRERIQIAAAEQGREIDMEPYMGGTAWADYAIKFLKHAEVAAREVGILDRLHLWPDHDALGSKTVIEQQRDPAAYLSWLQKYWNRISEWPGKTSV